MQDNNASQIKTLMHQTCHMLIGLLAIMGSQLVDSAFIGQLGSQPLAVLGFTIPVYQLVIGIQVGLGIAATATISTALGANKVRYAKVLATLSLFIGTLITSIVCVMLWVFQETIVSFLGAEQTIFSMLSAYWLPWLISCWLGAILYFGYSICRANGQTVMPGKVMVITSVLNIVLDPLFIFTFDMGMAGAAWATCVAFFIGCLIVFKSIIHDAFIAFAQSISVIKNGLNAIISFTIPAMLSQFIPPVSAALVTALVASYGEIAIASWGLANRIEYLSIILILALTMSLPPMIGKLKGKNDIEGIYFLIKVAVSIVLVIQLVWALIMFVIASPITHILTNNPEVAALVSSYLWLVPISYGALGVCMISVSACNAMGQPATSLIISILRLLGCYLPCLWIGAQIDDLHGLFIGATMGNILSGIVGWWMFHKSYLKLKQCIRQHSDPHQKVATV